MVRSKVDFNNGVIKLAAAIPDKYGVTDIIMDGSTGFYGKISERSLGTKEELSRVDFMYIKLLSANNVIKEFRQTSDGYRVWKTVAEMDDIVFNNDKTYSYPIYYFAKGTRLAGMYLELPIVHFNHYVHMRDLWFRDYKGSTTIHLINE